MIHGCLAIFIIWRTRVAACESAKYGIEAVGIGPERLERLMGVRIATIVAFTEDRRI